MAGRPVFLADLGRFFVGLREQRSWNQSQAAAFAKRRGLSRLSYNALRYLEDGRTKNPEPDLLRAVAALYELPYEELLARFWQARYGVSADRVAAVGEPKQTTVSGFVALPLLRQPIAAGHPLVVEPDPERDTTLAFADWFVSKYTRPVCLKVGKREESMMPTIQPGDVIAIDQAESVRSRPANGRIYAVNFGPLTGEGGAVKRIELTDGHLILLSDNADKGRFPTRVFDIEGKSLLDILRGEVVWFGRYVGERKPK